MAISFSWELGGEEPRETPRGSPGVQFLPKFAYCNLDTKHKCSEQPLFYFIVLTRTKVRMHRTVLVGD